MKNIRIEQHIVYEDNHIIVVNKPAGLLTQGDYSNEQSLFSLLKNYIKITYSKPGNVYLAMIHRLDKPVSGLLVFCKTSKSASRLNKDFASRKITKIYFALLDSDGQALPLLRWQKHSGYISRIRDTSSFSEKNIKNSQEASLLLYPLEQNNKNTACLIKLISGRKHQIRAQMQALGCPVSGDEKYGSSEKNTTGICLHSCFLSFEHPVQKKTMSFYCEPPALFDFLTTELETVLHTALLKTDNISIDT